MRTSGLKSDCFQSKAASGGIKQQLSFQSWPCRMTYESGACWLTYGPQVDIDCAEKNGFDETDKKYLEELAALLGRACDW